MKYAVFSSGGKQYKVSEGDVVELEKLKVEVGKDIVFDNVLLYVEDGAVKVGQPNVPVLTISAKVLDHIKAKKIRVATFKAKSRYRRVQGHRQELTRLKIEKIGKETKEVKIQKSKVKIESKKASR